MGCYRKNILWPGIDLFTVSKRIYIIQNFVFSYTNDTEQEEKEEEVKKKKNKKGKLFQVQ